MPRPKSTTLYVPRAGRISTSLVHSGSLLSLLTETALLRLFSAQYNESCSLPGYSAEMGLSMDSFSRNHLARPKLPSFWALQRLGACGPTRCTPPWDAGASVQVKCSGFNSPYNPHVRLDWFKSYLFGRCR